MPDPKADLTKIVADAVHPGRLSFEPDTCGTCRSIREIVEAVLAAGWQPPGTKDPRIDAILGVLAPLGLYWTRTEHLTTALQRIRAILRDEPLPEPHVYLEGDTVPAGRWVAYNTSRGLAASVGDVHWATDVGPAVEIPFPSLEAWQAAVDRTRAERRADEEAATDDH